MANQYEVVFKLQGELNQTFKQSVGGAAQSFDDLSDRMKEINQQMANTKGIEAQLEAYYSLGRKVEEQAKILEACKGAAEREGSSTETATKKFEKERRTLENLQVQRRRMINDIRNACYANGHEAMTIKELQENYFRLEKQLAKVAKMKRVAADQMALQKEVNGNVQAGLASALMAQGVLANLYQAFKGPAKAAAEIEKAMQGIAKASDFKDADGLQKFQDALRNISLEIPVTTEEILKAADAGKKFGIPVQELEAFTKSAAKMSMAFDMTASQAAEQMGRWRSAMKLTQAQADELANAIQGMANNGAVAQGVSEIITSLGAFAKSAGLTEKGLAAIASSFMNTGLSVDETKSAIESMVKTLQKGGSLTEEQNAALSFLKLDGKALQKQMQTDAEGAILKVLTALANFDPAHQGQYLQVLFKGGADAILPMLKSTALLKNNLEEVKKVDAFKGAIDSDINEKLQLTSTNLELLSNAMEHVKGSLGDAISEPVKTLAQSMVVFSKNLAGFVKDHRTLVKYISIATATFVGLIAAVHVARAAIQMTSAAYGSLKLAVLIGKRSILMFSLAMSGASKAMLIFKTALSGASVAMGGLGKCFAVVGRGLTVLQVCLTAAWKSALRLAVAFGPYIAIAAAVAGAGYLIYKNWDKITEVFQDLWKAFSEKWPAAAKIIEDIYNSQIRPAVEGITEIFSGLKTIIEGAFDLDLNKILAGFNSIASGILNIFSSMSIANMLKAPINAAIELINLAVEKINGATGFLRGNSFAKTVGLDMPEIPKIPMLADGGIISSPTLAVVGEGGESEVVLPISKLREMLGGRTQSSTVQPLGELPNLAPPQASGGFGLPSLSVNFAPVINVTSSGADTGSQVSSALRQGQIDFKRELEQLLRNRRRLAY
jgi:TP901 family phage tail tape measure protein